MARVPNTPMNVLAFLDMLGYSEGTVNSPTTQDGGYDQLFGQKRFTSYADHPNQVFTFTDKTGKKLTTTAAGKYQILYRFWAVYKVQLKLPDFSPISQDKVALQLIRECRATDDIIGGSIRSAIGKCSSRWASLPGAGYNQHENSYEKLLAYYIAAGGTLIKGE